MLLYWCACNFVTCMCQWLYNQKRLLHCFIICLFLCQFLCVWFSVILQTWRKINCNFCKKLIIKRIMLERTFIMCLFCTIFFAQESKNLILHNIHDFYHKTSDTSRNLCILAACRKWKWMRFRITVGIITVLVWSFWKLFLKCFSLSLINLLWFTPLENSS